jgi:hypothetical protein
MPSESGGGVRCTNPIELCSGIFVMRSAITTGLASWPPLRCSMNSGTHLATSGPTIARHCSVTMRQAPRPIGPIVSMRAFMHKRGGKLRQVAASVQ